MPSTLQQDHGTRHCWLSKSVLHMSLLIIADDNLAFTPLKSPIQDLQQDFLALSLSNVTPSTGGKVEEFLTRQSQDDYIECGRPAERSPIYPPSLYSDICAQAIDARNEKPTELDETLFNALNPVMRNIYEEEEKRKSEIRRVFSNESLVFQNSSIQESLRNSAGTATKTHTFTTDNDFYVEVATDGGASFKARYGYAEVKNETSGTGGAVAFFEGLLYYCAGSKVVSDCKVDSHLPAILMTIVGMFSNVQFHLPFSYDCSRKHSFSLLLCLFRPAYLAVTD